MRPDVLLVAGGVEYGLRPSFEALEAVERRCDAGVGKLLGRFTSGDVRFTDCAAILIECSRAYESDPKKRITRDLAAKLVQEHHAEVALAVVRVVGGAFGPPEVGQAGPTQTPATSP